MTKEEYEALPEHLQKIMARPPIPMWDADSLYLENAKTGEKREWVRVIRCENCKKWNTNDGMFKDFDGKEWHECKELNVFTSACGNVPITPSWHYCSWADRKEEK